ncbi:sensor histidine kinase [uncultured Jatrophihabitans sp.]|uniref:sensor histidine kinase n=1 Tax=uncultured Jatrophihabitans sp. TaxID=1610747 RepID=UPI0035CAD25E
MASRTTATGAKGTGLLGGVRPVDLVVTAVLCALAALLALEDILGRDTKIRIDSHSWLILPVAVASAVPVLWWRRELLAVLAVSSAVMAVHVLAFGSMARCGSGLPLTFVVAFLSGLERRPRQAAAALVLTGVLGSLVMVRDTAAGVGLLPVVLAMSVVLFGIGRVVAHRSRMAADLRQRNEDLRRLRDERAALEVSEERLRLSARLETLLDERLGQLAAAAEGGSTVAGAAGTKALLATLEDDGRRTLGEMREIVGLLRGGEVSLTPVPSVAHLDALLARHLRGEPRLQVSGNPRLLPAVVELSAYRIVEHLITALGDDPAAPVRVAVAFSDDALEIQVSGPVSRGSDIRDAVNRARERARLHAGTLEVRTARGQTRLVALLPVQGAPARGGG